MAASEMQSEYFSRQDWKIGPLEYPMSQLQRMDHPFCTSARDESVGPGRAKQNVSSELEEEHRCR